MDPLGPLANRLNNSFHSTSQRISPKVKRLHPPNCLHSLCQVLFKVSHSLVKVAHSLVKVAHSLAHGLPLTYSFYCLYSLSKPILPESLPKEFSS
jgi:hypothetical protein